MKPSKQIAIAALGILIGYGAVQAARADTDYTCVDSCTAQGMSFEFCHSRACVYTPTREQHAQEDRHIDYEHVYRMIERGHEPDYARDNSVEGEANE